MLTATFARVPPWREWRRRAVKVDVDTDGMSPTASESVSVEPYVGFRQGRNRRLLVFGGAPAPPRGHGVQRRRLSAQEVGGPLGERTSHTIAKPESTDVEGLEGAETKNQVPF